LEELSVAAHYTKILFIRTPVFYIYMEALRKNLGEPKLSLRFIFWGRKAKPSG
jgi:hypothetical protein